MLLTPRQAEPTDFSASLGCLVEPAVAGLAAQLGQIGALSDLEQQVLAAAAAASIYDAVHRRVARVLVVELHAARLTGQLVADTPDGRWDEFVARTQDNGYWAGLETAYPQLRARLATVVDNRCRATWTLARRFARDRADLAAVPGADIGTLTAVTLGQGDCHLGGQSVATLSGPRGQVVYKPRSVAIDATLDAFLAVLFDDDPQRIRVPAVADRGKYGWAEHVSHRYCADDSEVARFYRNLGHWLAVMRLLGGSDLHAENLIACGPTPVVIDCETLFTPVHQIKPSGLGQAIDRAVNLLESSVLRTGLLPGRGLALGWRGIDMSAIGALPGQQPRTTRPMLLDAGTDQARISFVATDAPLAQNHPSPQPVLGQHWHQVLAGFTELTDRLSSLDRLGELESMLDRFRSCVVRVVPRSTESYAELERMLWHPASLHNPPPALAKAHDILSDMARESPGAPDDPAVIAAEIDELLHGDVPVFTTTAGHGRLAGPGGTSWLDERDLVTDALDGWRTADFALEHKIIQSTVVSAYLNEGWVPAEVTLLPESTVSEDLDRRRRTLLSGILNRLATEAIQADDGSVTWVAPIFNETGWAVQPLSPDLYSGSAGMAALVAAYQHQVRRELADPVAGLDELLTALIAGMVAVETVAASRHHDTVDERPPLLGAHIGLGGRIWTWLLLDRLGADDRAVNRAMALAEQVPAALPWDEAHSLMVGAAGAVVPLLSLAQRTGDQRWLDLATQVGDRLRDSARQVPLPSGVLGVMWPTSRWPSGIGGVAHGCSGIGWALGRLAQATGLNRFADLARQAIAFEDLLWDEIDRGWRDLREPERCAHAWCHGSVGIGMVALDLLSAGFDVELAGTVNLTGTVERAVAGTWSEGFGWNHTICHGDLGAWEFIDMAARSGHTPRGLDLAALDARTVSSIEQYGPVSGFVRDTFAPGLFPGVGGIAYQLLRFDRTAGLPSVLLLGGDSG